MAAKQFLMMAGGTGGHVFPALATARRLEAAGHSVHWLGSQAGMEEELVKAAGIPLSLIAIKGLRGKGRLAMLAAPGRLLRALWQAMAVVRKVRPDCVVGMGGFVTGPGGLAAWIMRRPLVIHEQNAIAGMTNRILARLATTVMEAFPGSFGVGVNAECTGNPVRDDLATLPEPSQRMAGRQGAVRLLVLGGSLGALALNQCVPQALARLDAEHRPEVRHQCGRRHQEVTQAAYREAGVDARIEPFVEDMRAAYEWADLVVCRAGALTVAELCAAGLGAVLVPFPHAVDDHQTHNAGYMVDGQAAILVPQTDLSPAHLAEILAPLCTSRQRIQQMAEAARRLARPDATDRVVNFCLEAAHA